MNIYTESNPTEWAMLRKHVFKGDSPHQIHSGRLPLETMATVFVTSEDPSHPIEHAFDDSRGQGGTRWRAFETGQQSVVLAFDAPQRIARVLIEVEERTVSRTQQFELAISTDGGQNYRNIRQQDYTFSPDGATFEQEDWQIGVEGVTHLRLHVVPDKQGKPCYATLTTLAVFT